MELMKNMKKNDYREGVYCLGDLSAMELQYYKLIIGRTEIRNNFYWCMLDRWDS